MIPLVLLAAGRSSRLGIPKGLVRQDGEPWLAKQIKNFARAGGREAVIVLGFDSEKYLAEIPELATCAVVTPGADTAASSGAKTADWLGVRVTVAVNLDPSRGQFSSIQTGLAKTTGDIFLLPVDVPAPSPETWITLLKSHGLSTVTIPTIGDRGGHPVILSRKFAENILDADPAISRLDLMIHALPKERVNRLSVDDESVVKNLNDAGDWVRS